MTSDAPNNQAPAGGGRSQGQRWPWLLTGSLMVNTLLVGLFIGQSLATPTDHSDRREGRPPPTEARIARTVLDAVPTEQRAEIRKAFREALRDVRPQFAARRRAQEALREAMAADPYDPDRLAAAFAELRQREAEMETAVQAALVEQFGNLSADERRAVAESLARRRSSVRGDRLRRWRERRSED